MSRGIAVRLSLLPSASLAIVLLVGGCDQPPSSTRSTAIDLPDTPEERFDVIVASLRADFENTESPGTHGTVVFGGEQTSRMSYSYRVLPELLPAGSAGGTPRAKVTIELTSFYALSAPPKKDQEEDAPRQPRPNPYATDPNAVSDDGSTTDAADVDFGDTTPRPKLDLASPSARSNEVKESRTYELEYRSERWELVTELAPDAEIDRLTLTRALRRQ